MRILPLLALGVAVAACSMDQDSSRSFPLAPSLDRTNNVVGQVYTMSNATAGNSVLAFNRSSDGSLTAAGSYSTGGLGTGGGLGNQGGIQLDRSGKTLIVVDAGSNEISSFRVNGDGSLTWADKVASGGTMPISVTISGQLVYVLNAGGAGNISGFTLSSDGDLAPIAGSTRPLSTSASGPAEVAFDPTGTKLVVTEKNTNRLSTYSVDATGVAHGPTVTPASGVTPFGFAFTNSGTLVVSEAFGGAPNASAVSSYAPTGDAWSVISGSVPTTETSACWIAITNSGRFAYTTNATSGTITGYAIHQGALTRLDADGVTGNIGAGSAPTEMTLSRDGKFLYAFAGGLHRIAAFAIGADGSLSALPDWAAGLPASANGLAAR
ncbi:MAG TPA: beta-propeller fold lactonase family protein [Gemmatimonadaceae bacterium]|jgi:6-phosphogluconolactonase|nr:beta-propeller fold lactonase family protein [Gemmatimonadaceae bacterium]